MTLTSRKLKRSLQCSTFVERLLIRQHSLSKLHERGLSYQEGKQFVALFYKLFVLHNLCTKTKVLLKSLMDDLLSLSVQVNQTVNNYDCTTIKDSLKESHPIFMVKEMKLTFYEIVNRIILK